MCKNVCYNCFRFTVRNKESSVGLDTEGLGFKSHLMDFSCFGGQSALITNITNINVS